MAKKTTTSSETKRPFTVEDHKELNRINTEKKRTAVNDALGFPDGDRFENDLTEILAGDSEEIGETVAIALIDCDEFFHINGDFGIEEGDRILIETGLYIKKSIPKDSVVYRIGGDEFGIIFKGTMEREDIFLFLNDLKNDYDVKTPDGVKQSITIGMATAFVDASRCAELVRKADGALFRAKRSGRNKVAMAKEEKMIPKTSHYTQDQLQRLTELAKKEGIGEAILLREALDMLFKKYDI
ncbi:MAG: diguanylate cyclase [Lachnospiraceae bacterium]|nr:diguanylate cyclase [Lachnospiraceae bacterium]